MPTFESDQSMSVDDRQASIDRSPPQVYPLPSEALISEAPRGINRSSHAGRTGYQQEPSSGSGKNNFSYTYRLISRQSESFEEETSRDDNDSGYNENRPKSSHQCTSVSERGSFKYSVNADSVRMDRKKLRRVLHDIAVRRRHLTDQSSEMSSRDTEDTFDRVEAWATTGYTSSHPSKLSGGQSRSSNNNTSQKSCDQQHENTSLSTSFETSQSLDEDDPCETWNNVSQVPYARVPHVTIKGKFAGKPFTHYVPIDLSELRGTSPPQHRPASQLINCFSIHHLAINCLFRDFERSAYRERLIQQETHQMQVQTQKNRRGGRFTNSPMGLSQSRHRSSTRAVGDISKRWKKRIAELSRISNVPSNYSECSTFKIQQGIRLPLPKHMYIIAPPHQLMKELSKRSQKQRFSGWQSAESQLRKSMSDSEETTVSEIAKKQSAEMIYASQTESCHLSTPISELLQQADSRVFSRTSSIRSTTSTRTQSMESSSSPVAIVHRWLSSNKWNQVSGGGGRVSRTLSHKLIKSNSFTPEGTSLLLLVNDQNSEGFWNLDESFADAFDVLLEDLLNASPIVTLPMPKTCNCARDITILVEDMSDQPVNQQTSSSNRSTSPRRSSLVRQGKVGELLAAGEKSERGTPPSLEYELDDIRYVSESESANEGRDSDNNQQESLEMNVPSARRSTIVGIEKVGDSPIKALQYQKRSNSLVTEGKQKSSPSVLSKSGDSSTTTIVMPDTDASTSEDHSTLDSKQVKNEIKISTTTIDENLLNVGLPRSPKRTLRNDSAVDYEEECRYEQQTLNLLLPPSSLGLRGGDLNTDRRGSYDDQAFYERSKMLSDDYKHEPQPNKRTGSIDDSSNSNSERYEPPDMPFATLHHRTTGIFTKAHKQQHKHSQDCGRQRCIKRALPRNSQNRRMSYHTMSKCSSDEVGVFVDQVLSDDYFESRKKPDTVENRIWATGLALVWLEKRCGVLFSEWELIAGKANKWMRNQKLPKGCDVESVKAAASQVLYILTNNEVNLTRKNSYT